MSATWICPLYYFKLYFTLTWNNDVVDRSKLNKEWEVLNKLWLFFIPIYMVWNCNTNCIMKHDGKSVTVLFGIPSETLLSLRLIWLIENFPTIRRKVGLSLTSYRLGWTKILTFPPANTVLTDKSNSLKVFYNNFKHVLSTVFAESNPEVAGRQNTFVQFLKWWTFELYQILNSQTRSRQSCPYDKILVNTNCLFIFYVRYHWDLGGWDGEKLGLVLVQSHWFGRYTR